MRFACLARSLARVIGLGVAVGMPACREAEDVAIGRDMVCDAAGAANAVPADSGSVGSTGDASVSSPGSELGAVVVPSSGGASAGAALDATAGSVGQSGTGGVVASLGISGVGEFDPFARGAAGNDPGVGALGVSPAPAAGPMRVPEHATSGSGSCPP